MKKTVLLTIAVFFLGTSLAVASEVDFLDTGPNHIYWPSWSNGSDDDNVDIIGDPLISGGTAYFNTAGQFTKVEFDYSSGQNLNAGDLFIDKGGDQDWDYVISATDTNTIDEIYDFTNIDFSATLPTGGDASGNTYNGYTLSNQFYDGQSVNYRENHPVSLNESYFVGGIDTIAANSTNIFQDFTAGGSGSILEISGFNLDVGSEFIIGFGPTCANDVIYESVANPVPIPTSIFLLGSGLVGLVGLRRKRAVQS